MVAEPLAPFDMPILGRFNAPANRRRDERVVQSKPPALTRFPREIPPLRVPQPVRVAVPQRRQLPHQSHTCKGRTTLVLAMPTRVEITDQHMRLFPQIARVAEHRVPERALAHQRPAIGCTGIGDVHRRHHRPRLEPHRHPSLRLRAIPIQHPQRLFGCQKHAVHTVRRVRPHLVRPAMVRQHARDLAAHPTPKLREHDHIRPRLEQRQHDPRRSPRTPTVQNVPRQDRKRAARHR